MRPLFLSPTEPRLRAGWRLLIQSLLLLVLTLCIGIPVILVPMALETPPHSLLPLEMAIPELLTSLAVEFLAITVSILVARRFLDKRSFTSLGLKLNLQALYDLLAGIVITGLMMGLIYLIMWSLGWIQFEGFAWQKAEPMAITEFTLLTLIAFVLTGWNEELLSRGYHLQNLADGLDLTWGVILSSAVFGVLHLANPNATWVSAVGIFLAGLFLAFAYLRTKQLWLSIGLHIGWNFFEGVVFGFPVSGMDFYRLVRQTVSGPELWTGGAFGPEAGLVVLPALLVGAVLVYVYSVVSRKSRADSRESGVVRKKNKQGGNHGGKTEDTKFS
ncbi:MAG: CPBP family intramembrane metalloprotease domain-containing protein [Anaerolineae bacterium CG_4_9_14_0_8_um_filter_58_9]|nr:MAG: CPBP family intramembrane metalloprotease domain-containing protein [Anaerolineae bacterium CG_4_9_14_0_8_um_filter_58_9]